MFAGFAASFIAALVLASGAAFADTKISRGFIPPQDGVAITELAGGLEYP